MKGSWEIGKIAGIDIRVHWTFLLLPLWVYFSSLASGGGIAAAVLSVAFLLAVFGCVVLHELGHALAARAFGIPTTDITLLPIGGLARLKWMPRNPGQELVIAIAGPAVNVVIGAGLMILTLFLGLGAGSEGLFTRFAGQLALVNFYLVLFNLIPAFPMDGGRVLRSVLAFFMPWTEATQRASKVGQFAAIVFGIIGLATGQFMLILIGLFVYFAAQAEAWSALAAESDGPIVMATPVERGFRSTAPDIQFLNSSANGPVLDGRMTAHQAADAIAHRPELDFLVVEDGQVIGSISRSEIFQAIVAGCGHWPIHHLLSMRFLGQPSPCVARPH